MKTTNFIKVVLIVLAISGLLYLSLLSFFEAHADVDKKINVGRIVVKGPTIESNKGYAVGIILSKACISLAKNNMTGPYPDYADLEQYDTSNKKWSGGFAYYDGYYHRLPAPYKNNMAYYQHESLFRAFVDPNADYSKMPLITIQCNPLKEFFSPVQNNVKENKTSSDPSIKSYVSVREYSKLRQVNSSCTQAVISGSMWQVLVPDTIEYMRKNCAASSTNVDTIGKDIKNITRHDISTSSKYKYDNFVLKVKNECAKTYGKCNVINKQVTTNSDSK